MQHSQPVSAGSESSVSRMASAWEADRAAGRAESLSCGNRQNAQSIHFRVFINFYILRHTCPQNISSNSFVIFLNQL